MPIRRWPTFAARRKELHRGRTLRIQLAEVLALAAVNGCASSVRPVDCPAATAGATTTTTIDPASTPELEVAGDVGSTYGISDPSLVWPPGTPQGFMSYTGCNRTACSPASRRPAMANPSRSPSTPTRSPIWSSGRRTIRSAAAACAPAESCMKHLR